jgi:hypothetical protein
LNFTNIEILAAPVGIVGAVLSLLLGIFFCFFGYRVFKIPLAISGFMFGMSLVSLLVYQFTGTVWIILAAGATGGICFLLLAIFILPVGLFILGAYLGAVIALYFFFIFTEVGIVFPYWIPIVVLALAGGITAVIVKKPLIVVASSFLGSWAIVTGVFTFIPPQSTTLIGWIQLAAWIVLGFAGVLVQYKVTAKKKLVQDRKQVV